MRFFVYGVVQGVGFRPTVYNLARSMGLRGYVRNCGANVEICVDRDFEKFIEALKEKLPPLARIERIEIADDDCTAYSDFIILQSMKGARESAIPTDTALCDECLKDMFSESNRRYLYPFTNCTNCGARYTVIKDLPFDREKTAMSPFKLCNECREEFENPSDRRFHAQTISCKVCGVEYTLYDREKNALSGDPFKEFAGRIDDGSIGVMKSWGGMHLICRFDLAKAFRKFYKRESKPFAVMLRDLKTVEKYVYISEKEKELLSSPQRPIVLLRKKGIEFLEDISPGLDTLGVMLPYAGGHHLLFHYLKTDGIIATSANIPDEPIIMKNEDAFKLKADYYLLHNREIVQRCDDSLLKTFDSNTFFIRRSRGFVPTPFKVNYECSILTVGAQMNVSASISKGKRIYTSQYIGNAESYRTLEFLEEAIKHLIKLLGIERLDAVGMDLHPRYTTRAIAKSFSEKYDCSLIAVQHHWAHALSLSVDTGVEEMVALTLDGTGFGTDGKVWGGEVLQSNFESFERVASLEEIPLLGGDKAIVDPRRIVFAVSEMLGVECKHFTESERDVLRKVMDKSVRTTSSGRVLDAISCHLGVCERATYDGEPAMKLEGYLEHGRCCYEFDVDTEFSERKVIRTVPLFEQLFAQRFTTEREKADLAYSFVHAMMKEMSYIACERAIEKGIEHVGITGGVSYSLPIVKIVKDVVEHNGLKLLLHNSVPNGDSGISIGQNVVAGNRVKDYI